MKCQKNLLLLFLTPQRSLSDYTLLLKRQMKKRIFHKKTISEIPHQESDHTSNLPFFILTNVNYTNRTIIIYIVVDCVITEIVYSKNFMII